MSSGGRTVPDRERKGKGRHEGKTPAPLTGRAPRRNHPLSHPQEDTMSGSKLTRRSTLKAAAAALALPAAGVWAAGEPAKPKGNLKQSICRWCYSRIKLEELAAKAKEIGYRSIELIGMEELKKIKPLGLTCAVLRSASSIPDGLNR